MSAPADARPGTYALVLTAARARAVQVGCLGTLRVEPGCYVYAGSAFGPGGVRGRLAHHTGAIHRAHWHVDFLRRATRLAEVWYTHDPSRREHAWARVLAGLPGAAVALAGFGASDCRCPAHLVHLPRVPSVAAFRRRLRRIASGHAAVHRWVAGDAAAMGSARVH
ncbi:MAG: GIY-YIG nuclease family protein [Myxococcota bacterium]|nr:GIY-YIG nuclease family protein [Myxococcota bacterium]